MPLAALIAAAALASSGAPHLDTHLDTPIHFGRAGWSVMQRHTYESDLTQVDWPRMTAGGLDGGFFVIYTAQGPLTPQGYRAARDLAFRREAHIREMVAANPAHFALAFTAADAARIKASGRKIVYQSIENSYPLGDDPSLLQTFYALGVRLAGPVHFQNNQFADSATDTPRWHGLSPLGRQWVAEANRLGIVIDASHASDAVFDQLLETSKTPIILSHSGPRAVFDHPRNIDDARLKKLAAAGGVIQINSVYLTARPPANAERDRLGDALEAIEDMTPAQQKALIAETAAFNRRNPVKRATFEMFMASLEHALKVAGPDHVGIGADWDGGGGVTGMEDVADLKKITTRLKHDGWSQADIAKIWGGNVLRVLAAAETCAASLKKAPSPQTQ